MNKVTKEYIDSRIANVEVKRLSAKITHVTITMVNGFEVTGESAVVDPKNYDANIGKEIAFENAYDKLWVLEGYLLQDKLYTKKMHILSEADEAEYRGMKDIAREKREYAHEAFPKFPGEELQEKISNQLIEVIEQEENSEKESMGVDLFNLDATEKELKKISQQLTGIPTMTKVSLDEVPEAVEKDPETVITLGLSQDETEAAIRIEFIAKACHEANKVWCEANNDYSQVHWEDAEQWQKDSAIQGVIFKLENPDAGEDAQHNAWMKHKLDEGWVYGKEKDAEKKTHPCLVPFSELPEFQQKKDRLFQAIVNALK